MLILPHISNAKQSYSVSSSNGMLEKSQLPLLRNYLEAVCGSPCKTACVNIYIYIIYMYDIIYIC